jgi:hypothetical protein
MLETMKTLTARRRWMAVLALTALLGACGGGSGDDAAGPTLESPPATAATLQASTGEASGAAGASMDAAQRLAQLSASLGSGAMPLARGERATLAAWGRSVLSSQRERALARETVGCGEFLGVAGNCSGTVTLDTNFDGAGTTIPAGTYVTLTFNSLSATVEGESLSLNGSLRMEYLTSFSLSAPSYAGLRLQLTFGNLSGTAQGVPFGPIEEVALYEFDGSGELAVTIDGLRIIGFDNMTLTDADNYTLPNVTLRRAHWAAATGYVDLHFSDWAVSEGRPQVGSQATISAGSNSITVEVMSSSTSTVVYRIAVSINGSATVYLVTATYPAGDGAPTYVAELADT